MTNKMFGLELGAAFALSTPHPDSTKANSPTTITTAIFIDVSFFVEPFTFAHRPRHMSCRPITNRPEA
jgi:hypothetical protein